MEETREELAQRGKIVEAKRVIICPKCEHKFPQVTYQLKNSRKLWRALCSECGNEITFVVDTNERYKL